MHFTINEEGTSFLLLSTFFLTKKNGTWFLLHSFLHSVVPFLKLSRLRVWDMKRWSFEAFAVYKKRRRNESIEEYVEMRFRTLRS
jgi:hypothetical protein